MLGGLGRCEPFPPARNRGSGNRRGLVLVILGLQGSGCRTFCFYNPYSSDPEHRDPVFLEMATLEEAKVVVELILFCIGVHE